MECISNLCSSSKLSLEHKELLALDALLPCHHPVVISAAPGFWLKIVKHLGIQPKDLVVKYITQFKSDLIENYHTSSVSEVKFKSIHYALLRIIKFFDSVAIITPIFNFTGKTICFS